MAQHPFGSCRKLVQIRYVLHICWRAAIRKISSVPDRFDPFLVSLLSLVLTMLSNFPSVGILVSDHLLPAWQSNNMFATNHRVLVQSMPLS